ncbi:MAG: hypothetical protein KBA26_13610 [Candidatus Delongbacteria bacterium]|nr:hypothetical protein [Candidatus Delongbacteria bacterium]
MKSKTNLHLVIGILAIAVSNLIKHLIGLPDFWQGFFHGIGLVFIIIGFIRWKFNLDGWCLFRKRSAEK